MNYVDDVSIYGLMNKNASLMDDVNIFGYYRVKNKSKIALFKRVKSLEGKYDQINYMYLDEQPGIEGQTSVQEIHSILDSGMFQDHPGNTEKVILYGKQFIELRGTRNKFERFLKEGSLVIQPLTVDNYEAVLQMIEKWRYLENGGMKYGFIEHAGIDKALVKRIVENQFDLQKKLISKVFFFNNECVAYSTIQRDGHVNENSGIVEYKYLTRKTLNRKDLRNLTEFVDYKTFEGLYQEKHDPRFLINWGCSSKKLGWYKMHKFPLFNTELKWFATLKK